MMRSGALTPEDLIDLRRFIRDACGLALGDDKNYLIEQRLGPLLELRSLKSFGELRAALRGSEYVFWRETVINAITTNETSFFRDGHPFDAFSAHVLPRLAGAIRRRRAEGRVSAADMARVWCAASSTGQEPYSLAMLINEYCAANAGGGFTSADFRVVGTDISPRVLERAKSAVFHEMDLHRGISAERRSRHFEVTAGGFRVRPEVRSIVSFARLNLLEPFHHLGVFDVVFCRNVLIYFDPADKRKIVSGIAQALRPDGELFVGSAESLYSVSSEFEPVEVANSVIYRRVGIQQGVGGNS